MYCILLSCILLGLCLQCIQAQPDPHVCIPGPGDSKGHKLPTLPEQYKLEVEAHIVNKNYTVESTEYYDDTNNRGSIKSQGNTGGDHSTFYDYDDSQYYTVYPNHTCITNVLNADTYSAFGYHTEGGKGHINSASDVFRFGDKFNETYMGQTTVDYTPADWWSSCVYYQKKDITYKIDFYFSLNSTKATIPIRMVINGTEILHRNETGEPDERRWFHHIYTYKHVVIGPQPNDVFLPPIGVLCAGRVNNKDLPRVPPHFGLTIEVVIPEDKTVHYIKEYYNFKHKKVSYEMIPTKQQDHRPRPTSVKEVHDFETGIAYRIVSSGACHINPIPLRAEDALSVDSTHVKMRVASNFFGLHAQGADWIYEGVTVNRDVVLDVWQSNHLHWIPAKLRGIIPRNFTVNSTWTYAFAVNGWTVDNERQGTLQNLPMRLEIDWVAHFWNKNQTGKEIHNFNRLTEEVTQAAYYKYFDVSQCYTHFNDSLHLAFNLEGKDTYTKYIANNTDNFYHGATESIAKALGVSLSRVANVQVVEGYHALSTIFFSLLDRPQVQGDALNQTDPGPALDRAYDQLDLLVNSKEGSMLTLEFIHHNDIVHVNAQVDTLREETKPLIQEKQTGLAIGPVIGVALGSLVFGVLIALLGAFIFYKKQTAEVPYLTQE